MFLSSILWGVQWVTIAPRPFSRLAWRTLCVTTLGPFILFSTRVTLSFPPISHELCSFLSMASSTLPLPLGTESVTHHRFPWPLHLAILEPYTRSQGKHCPASVCVYVCGCGHWLPKGFPPFCYSLMLPDSFIPADTSLSAVTSSIVCHHCYLGVLRLTCTIHKDKYFRCIILIWH